MRSHERKRAIADAKVRAEAMAAQHIRRGARRNASEVELLRAETATNVLWIASKRASLLPADECAKWTEGLKQLWEEHEVNITAATEAEIAKGHTDFTAGPVREAIDASLAALEARTEAKNEWMDNHQLAAWLHACDDFATWDKALGALAKPEGGKHVVH